MNENFILYILLGVTCGIIIFLIIKNKLNDKKIKENLKIDINDKNSLYYNTIKTKNKKNFMMAVSLFLFKKSVESSNAIAKFLKITLTNYEKYVLILSSYLLYIHEYLGYVNSLNKDCKNEIETKEISEVISLFTNYKKLAEKIFTIDNEDNKKFFNKMFDKLDEIKNLSSGEGMGAIERFIYEFLKTNHNILMPNSLMATTIIYTKNTMSIIKTLNNIIYEIYGINLNKYRKIN